MMLAFGLHGGRAMLVDEECGEVRWNVQAHACVARGNGPPCWACASSASARVAMSPNNGRYVASVGPCEEIWKFWDAATGAEWMAGARHDGTGACICFFNNLGQRFLHPGCPVVAHTAGLISLAFSPCGQRLATLDKHGTVILWDAQTGEAQRRMEGVRDRDKEESTHARWSLSFSADGVRLASGCLEASNLIRVWNSRTGALLRTFDASEDYAAVQFSPTGFPILATADHGTGWIRVWNVDTGEMVRSFEGMRYFAEFSPDGRTIATAIDGGREVMLVDAETRTVRLTLVAHQGFVRAVSFSVDGSKLASVGLDQTTCKVWDSSTGALLRTIELGTAKLFSWTSLSWGRDWVRDTLMPEAFAMGHHPRLGAGSRVLALDEGVVRMILDRV